MASISPVSFGIPEKINKTQLLLSTKTKELYFSRLPLEIVAHIASVITDLQDVSSFAMAMRKELYSDSDEEQDCETRCSIALKEGFRNLDFIKENLTAKKWRIATCNASRISKIKIYASKLMCKYVNFDEFKNLSTLIIRIPEIDEKLPRCIDFGSIKTLELQMYLHNERCTEQLLYFATMVKKHVSKMQLLHKAVPAYHFDVKLNFAVSKNFGKEVFEDEFLDVLEPIFPHYIAILNARQRIISLEFNGSIQFSIERICRFLERTGVPNFKLSDQHMAFQQEQFRPLVNLCRMIPPLPALEINLTPKSLLKAAVDFEILREQVESLRATDLGEFLKYFIDSRNERDPHVVFVTYLERVGYYLKYSGVLAATEDYIEAVNCFKEFRDHLDDKMRCGTYDLLIEILDRIVRDICNIISKEGEEKNLHLYNQLFAVVSALLLCEESYEGAGDECDKHRWAKSLKIKEILEVIADLTQTRQITFDDFVLDIGKSFLCLKMYKSPLLTFLKSEKWKQTNVSIRLFIHLDHNGKCFTWDDSSYMNTFSHEVQLGDSLKEIHFYGELIEIFEEIPFLKILEAHPSLTVCNMFNINPCSQKQKIIDFFVQKCPSLIFNNPSIRNAIDVDPESEWGIEFLQREMEFYYLGLCSSFIDPTTTRSASLLEGLLGNYRQHAQMRESLPEKPEDITLKTKFDSFKVTWLSKNKEQVPSEDIKADL